MGVSTALKPVWTNLPTCRSAELQRLVCALSYLSLSWHIEAKTKRAFTCQGTASGPKTTSQHVKTGPSRVVWSGVEVERIA